jgi:hypothetical protein
MIADICSKTRDRKIENETFHAAWSQGTPRSECGKNPNGNSYSIH